MKENGSYIISTIVEHKPGVFYQASNMFRRRGFNIETITVGESEQAGLSEMTITIKGDEKIVEQVIRQLNKLLDIVKVSILNPKFALTKEIALIKINTPNPAVRSDMINCTEIFKGRNG